MHDAGRHDEAFQFYSEGNRNSTKNSKPDSTFEITNVRAAVSGTYLQQRKNFGVADASPIFIVGMPRSGTTLTESLCGAHSKIFPGDELPYFPALFKSLGMRGELPKAFVSAVQEMTEEFSVELAQTYLSRVRPIVGNAEFFTDKLPHNFVRVGLIKLLFPNAKIIHCRRHPLDNCVSIFTNSMRKFHNTYKSDLKTLGLYYRQYWQLMQHWREIMPGAMHEVYYEDMVANTELNARDLIAHIGLEWEDGVMDRQNSQKSVKTLSAWQVRQPVYTSSAGRWRVYEKHLGPLIDILEPIVEQYEAELAALETQNSGTSQ